MSRLSSPDQVPALRYTLPAAGGSVWLGLGWLSLTGLAVTLTVTVLLLLAGLPLAVVLPLTLTGFALSALPIAGRPLLGWFPILLGQQLARLCGTHRWARPLADTHATSEAFHAGRQGRNTGLKLGIGPRQLRLTSLQVNASDDSDEVGAEHSPGEADDLGLVSHDRASHGRSHGRMSGRQTLVLDVLGLGRFGLLDARDQDTELARWGTCLATLCADPAVTSVQWISHARPDSGRRHHPAPSTWQIGGCGGATLAPDVDPSDAARRDYADLVEGCADNATRHRHLLAVTLKLSAHQGLRAGTDDPRVQAARDIASTLLAADLLARPLRPAELGESIRFLLDPDFDPDLRAGSTPQAARADANRWVPLSTRNSWDHCSTDDSLHRCFVITGWPRLALTADWLSPLLHHSPIAGSSRTLTVHARPVAPEHATRRARAASTKARLDAHDRSRLGFTSTPGLDDTNAETDALEAEAELLAGYRMTDLSALLTISAVSDRQLQLACQQLRNAATAQRLELRPLHGQHLPALASTLPLGLHPGASS